VSDREVVRLEIPPRSDHLALVRLLLSGTLAIDRPVPERRVEDLRLAVTEACANAIDAHQASGDERPIEIAIESSPGRVAVTVTDHAGGFDPKELAPLPSVTDPGRLRHERGLGMSLMRSHVDDLAFRLTEDGTEVTLVVLSGP
jgi:serine/threonine-protein kinase RsbW